jgi:Cdc6-like AAA superfamily ATPase
VQPEQIQQLRRVINENLRVQRGGADPIPYIDVTNAVGDVSSRQNHAVFGRRGCGKTLLLHHSSRNLPSEIKGVYLNCEDFKKHSYPNVLIEILDALFAELESHLAGWFGRRRRSRDLIQKIRSDLTTLRDKADEQDREIREATSAQAGETTGVEVGGKAGPFSASVKDGINQQWKHEMEEKYHLSENKIRELDTTLPELKRQIREFFDSSSTVKAVYLQIDDFYHLNRRDQPLVMDYIHRLCKDVPLYFKVATLRHATILFADRDGQPIGAQERHDYQPVNIDFDFSNLRRTQDVNAG